MPRPIPWKLIDADTLVPMSTIQIDFTSPGGNGNMSRTLTRIDWSDVYNTNYRPYTYTKIPAGNFVCVRWSPTGMGIDNSPRGSGVVGIYGGIAWDGGAHTDDAITGPQIVMPPSHTALIFNIAVSAFSDTDTLITVNGNSTEALGGRTYWYSNMDFNNPFGEPIATSEADDWEWTVNGKTRSDMDPVITLTNVHFEEDSLMVTCDDTTGLVAGMFIINYDMQVVRVIDSRVFQTSKLFGATVDYPTMIVFGGNVTDSGSGALNTGFNVTNIGGESLTVTVS